MKKKPTQREAAERVVARLCDAGHVALFAGGCVRDLVMKRTPKDYDVATDAVPGRVVELFRRTERVGAKFGVVLVRLGGHAVEVATFRSDGTYTDGRHPESICFSDPQHDAQRRDFTINGMFYDPVKKQVIDLVGGQEDIRRGLIRAIGDARQRLAEDHLRMLRAVRFAARLGFEIEAETAAAIRALAENLPRISPERIRAELTMILADPSRSRGWELLHDSGQIAWLAADTAWTNDEAADVAARLDHLPARCSDRLAVAVVLRKYSPAKAARRCRALTCSNQLVGDVAWLLHELPRMLACRDFDLADYKLLLADDRCADLVRLAEAEIGGRSMADEPLVTWRRETAAIPSDAVAPPPLVTGDDLTELGYAPGPAFGRVLQVIYRRQLNGALVDRCTALEAARRLLDDPGD
ncbi:MAG: CCA tRNA nucleotidyltransferase [bacterium]|nr:CCA tRNA nucleotidyltransferase [bacterium]